MARGSKLTGSLLAFARKQRLEPVLTDLNCVVVEMTDLLRRSIGPSVEVRHALAPALWPTLIDTSQIATALLNIAINARDAMPFGGVLVIETANIRAGDDEMPKEVVDNDCVFVSMTDTGAGMSPDVIERAFEPFFTTKGVGKGTGLGLSMVFGFVQQSGGAVRLRSRVGEGTTVEVYLPRARGGISESPAEDTMPAARGRAARSTRHTAMAATDARRSFARYQDQFAELDPRVRLWVDRAATAGEALRQTPSRPRYDLLRSTP